MEQLHPLRSEHPSRRVTESRQRAFSIVLPAIAAVLLLTVLRAKLRGEELPTVLMAAVATGFVAVILLGTGFLIRALREHRESEARFQQMASNIREIFWMIDAGTRRALYVNEAYETITGRSCESLRDNPTSYEELIHPEDRTNVLAKLEEATRTGQFNERFRIVSAHGEVHWVTVHGTGFPCGTPQARFGGWLGPHRRSRNRNEQKIKSKKPRDRRSGSGRSRGIAQGNPGAHTGPAHGFRYGCATALTRGVDPLLVRPGAGSRRRFWHWVRDCFPEPAKTSSRYRPGYPLTLIADKSPFLKRMLEDRKSVLIPDTKQEAEWQSFKGHSHLRSWLSVPLVASDEYLGFLSVGHEEPNRYTQEHLRRAELLAIPAAVAIQNARLFARADIFASELQRRLADLHKAENALAQSEGDRQLSEEKFQKVFRSSPIPFSITTLKEGRFLDVNAAFERRYGYAREEALGHTVHELRIWEDPADRVLMIEQLQRGGPIRNVITRLRTKSGEVKLTAYSADRIQFDGQSCILAVSEDLPEYDKGKVN
jgi:PAS domain S-box-containing protein